MVLAIDHEMIVFTLHMYRGNIKWQKCAGMGLNGFIFKEIDEN